MMLHAYASQHNYAEHISYLWSWIPESIRGTFYTSKRLDWIDTTPGLPPQYEPVLVAGMMDVDAIGGGRPVAMIEHGSGQTYSSNLRSNPGGPDRYLGLFLAPNERVCMKEQEVYPNTRCVAIGSPRLDALTDYYLRNFSVPPVLPSKALDKPTVGLSFRWPDVSLPETRPALSHYQYVLPKLTDDFRVLAHAHPRILERYRPTYEEAGLEVTTHFSDLLLQADIFVVDNSSSLFEWVAITDKPVLVLNAPWYRKNVHHGMRFWADIPGPQCDSPEELNAAIFHALVTKDEWIAERRRVSKKIYPLRGQSGPRGAATLSEWLAETSYPSHV